MKPFVTPALAALALALAAPFFAAPSALARSATPVPSAAETRAGHISIVRLGTKGPAVILIPGLATPRAVWEAIAPDLARHHRVWLVQVNGFGGDAPGENLKPGVLSGVVADLAGLIARERLGRPAVIGHSLGGLAGLMLARDYPDAVGRLLVVDALPWYGVLFGGPEASVATLEPQARAMRDGVAAMYGKPANPAVIAAQTQGMALAPAAQPRLREWAAAADARVVAAAMYEDLTTDLRRGIAAIRAPVTVIVPWHPGRFTREQTLGFYRAQYAALPATQLVPMDQAAHFVMLDQPQSFAAAVHAFLAASRPAAPASPVAPEPPKPAPPEASRSF